MPSTHLSLNYHIVFSTKNREPILAASWRAELHAYLGGILRDLGGVAQEVGGVADHVHFLAALKATHCLADVLRDTKTGSSRWIHETMRIRSFAWQEGYGAVTVSPSDVPPGSYRVKAWHEKFGTLEQEVSVAPGSESRISFDYQTP